MRSPETFEFDDLQALLRFGHGRLSESCFMLLDVVDGEAARRWLREAPITRAVTTEPPPAQALQIAFTVEGLRRLGLPEVVIAGFSDEFLAGISGDPGRSRRLGDVEHNAPARWDWGGDPARPPQVLLLLYARPGGLERWRDEVQGDGFAAAFDLRHILPTGDLGRLEPFGFVDGISQPEIDWDRRQSTALHRRDRYSNRLAVGELLLGYPNEYGQYSSRPLIDPRTDPAAAELPTAEEQPGLRDLGRNGCYLVLRQLQQDVPGFWRFVDRASDSLPEARERLAASMVGRTRDGRPLAPFTGDEIPGIPLSDRDNHFTYAADPRGHACPLGAHVRRANPRTGDFPPGVSGWFSRLLRILGFGQSRPDEDLIASTRFHRLLRRGRPYGARLTPEEALAPDTPDAERGLQFICLVANISRQFEFVQNAWSMNSKFAGLQQEQDPLLGDRQPLSGGESSAGFSIPDPGGPARRIDALPRFVTVRGGGYFFLPGLRALRYLSTRPTAREAPE